MSIEIILGHITLLNVILMVQTSVTL
jgi:hypothetical protein